MGDVLSKCHPKLTIVHRRCSCQFLHPWKFGNHRGALASNTGAVRLRVSTGCEYNVDYLSRAKSCSPLVHGRCENDDHEAPFGRGSVISLPPVTSKRVAKFDRENWTKVVAGPRARARRSTASAAMPSRRSITAFSFQPPAFQYPRKAATMAMPIKNLLLRRGVHVNDTYVHKIPARSRTGLSGSFILTAQEPWAGHRLKSLVCTRCSRFLWSFNFRIREKPRTPQLTFLASRRSRFCVKVLAQFDRSGSQLNSKYYI